MFERTYGVEIEAIFPISRESVAAAITAAGIECTTESYNHSTRRHWKIITDRSLSGTAGYGAGYELVSPPLSGQEGYRQIEKVCEILKHNGCHANKTCGLHVHVDARTPRMDLPALKRLALIYAENEIIIDQVMPESRRGSNNTYCLSIRAGLNRINNAGSVEELSTALGEKYVKLNFKPYFRQGTVEFRHHSGTVEASKITNWVSACLRMVKCAADELVAETITVERVAREARAVRAGSKTAIIHALLTRPEGCTTAEVLAATGWRQVSVAGVGHNLGLSVRQVRERENGRRVIRYFGERRSDPVSLPTHPIVRRENPKTVEEFADRLGMSEEEKVFWLKRQALFSDLEEAEIA